MIIIQTTSGEIIKDERMPPCHDCIAQKQEIISRCPIDKKQARHSTVSIDDGEIFECSKKHGFIQSKRKHHEVLAGSIAVPLRQLVAFKAQIQQRYERDYRRLLHNIISHNAHIIQEIENIALEDELSRAENQVSFISQIVSRDPTGSAKVLLKIFQSAIGIKSEISTYKRLYLDEGKVEPQRHNVHRLFMNAAYKFFADFTDINVRVRVDSSKAAVVVDYESVAIVLYHMLDNARKYILPHTDLYVRFEDGGAIVRISLDMVSTKIEPDDLTRMYEEGYSGTHARRLGKQGTGFGMAIVREVLHRSGLRLDVYPGTHVEARSGEAEYARNRFDLSLPKWR